MRRQAAASKAAAAEAKAAAEKAKAKAKAKEAAEQKQMQVTAAKKRADAAKKAAAKSKSIAAKKAAAKAAQANEAAAKKEAAEKAAKQEAEEAAAESDAAKAAAKKAKARGRDGVVGQGLSAAGPMQSGGAGKTSNKLPERGAAASGVLHFAANSIVVCSICKACMATPQRCKELLCFNCKTPLLLLPLPLPLSPSAAMATKESLTASIKELAAKVTALKQAKESKDVFMPVVKEMQALKAQYDQNAPPLLFLLARPPAPRGHARPPPRGAAGSLPDSPSGMSGHELTVRRELSGCFTVAHPPTAQVQGGDGGGL